MELEGKVILDLGQKSGISSAGREWKKKEWVVETFGQYPRKVKVQAFGARADQVVLEVGNSYTLSVDAESREYNGNWFTDLSVYAARPYAPQGAYPQPGGYPQQPAAYPQQGGYPQAPQPYQQGAPAAQAFGGDAFPPAPTPGAGAAFPAGDSSDDLPF